MKRLWVDDEKDPPDEDFVVARTYAMARDLLMHNQWDELHLDYVLDQAKTGQQLLEEVGIRHLPPRLEPISTNAESNALLMMVWRQLKLTACAGCYNDDYNRGLGGATECWSLATMYVTLRRRVHRDEVPPWRAAPEALPNCYQQRQYIFVKPTQEY